MSVAVGFSARDANVKVDRKKNHCDSLVISKFPCKFAPINKKITVRRYFFIGTDNLTSSPGLFNTSGLGIRTIFPALSLSLR
jgi:hypothetical protein